MQTMTSQKAQKHFGNMLDLAQRGPVKVTRYGQPVVFILGSQDFEKINEQLQDKVWGEKALAAEKEGYLGTDEGEELLNDLINAET